VTDLSPDVRTALAGLHDSVLQRVYATGIGLQALVGQLPDDDLADRLRTHIADLDVTLDEIRATLFELREVLTPTG
jgi:signal transduction histidine kinase